MRVLSCFNPRLPGGRRHAPAQERGGVGYVSIHAFRGEGDSVLPALRRLLVVSIHAFRGEGDLIRLLCKLTYKVSIHAFRGEGDMVIKRMIDSYT